MRKFFIVKTEMGYVTSYKYKNGDYEVESYNKNHALLFPFHITEEDYQIVYNNLHNNGFKNISFVLEFRD